MDNLKSAMNNNKQFLSQALERRPWTNRRSSVQRPAQSQPQPRTEEVLVSSAWTVRAQRKLQLLDRTIQHHRDKLGRQQAGAGAGAGAGPLSQAPSYLRPPRPALMTQFKSPALRKS